MTDTTNTIDGALASLDGQVAIVTGGAQGIGRGIAERLVEDGCAVVITDRQELIIEVASEIGATGRAVRRLGANR